jgi:hypothetical protein
MVSGCENDNWSQRPAGGDEGSNEAAQAEPGSRVHEWEKRDYKNKTGQRRSSRLSV